MNFESFCYFMESTKRRISFASLYPAQSSEVHSGSLCCFFLRKLLPFSDKSNFPSDLNINFVPPHALFKIDWEAYKLHSMRCLI